MFDFPASPTVGQKYSAYAWDGEKWMLTLADGADLPIGTVLPFYLAAAPSGWTKLTSNNDKMMRVVSGSGGVSGGTNSFSSVMAQTAIGNSSLTTAMLTSHAHTLNSNALGQEAIGYSGAVLWSNFAAGAHSNFYYGINSSPTGSGSAHNHPITMSMQYIDLILASKD